MMATWLELSPNIRRQLGSYSLTVCSCFTKIFQPLSQSLRGVTTKSRQNVVGYWERGNSKVKSCRQDFPS